jgi:uncharacterized protein DUF6636
MLAAPLLVVLYALAPAETPPEQNMIGFQTPSHNVACQFFSWNGQDYLRCDVAEMNLRPKPPPYCHAAWGDAFGMSVKGRPERLCHGDTVSDRSLPVLAYGQIWQRGGFTCRSEPTGLLCFNVMMRGFGLSWARQAIF